jgi:hypothetical protein
MSNSSTGRTGTSLAGLFDTAADKCFRQASGFPERTAASCSREPSPDSPVGYDNFQQGTCQYQDTDRALYQVRLPQAVEDSGIHLVSAVVNAKVAYSSSCGVKSTDTLSWINGFNSDTGWSGPNRTSNNTDVTADFVPDTSTNNGTSVNSCDGTFVKNDGPTIANGFNVKSDISDATGSTFTFRIWQTGSEASDDTYHEQFTNNPYLAVQFFYSPNTPSTSGMQESSNSTGSNAKACAATTASAPTLQVSSSGTVDLTVFPARSR